MIYNYQMRETSFVRPGDIVQLGERLAIGQAFRLIEIAHETDDPEVKKAALRCYRCR